MAEQPLAIVFVGVRRAWAADELCGLDGTGRIECAADAVELYRCRPGDDTVSNVARNFLLRPWISWWRSVAAATPESGQSVETR